MVHEWGTHGYGGKGGKGTPNERNPQNALTNLKRPRTRNFSKSIQNFISPKNKSQKRFAGLGSPNVVFVATPWRGGCRSEYNIGIPFWFLGLCLYGSALYVSNVAQTDRTRHKVRSPGATSDCSRSSHINIFTLGGTRKGREQ